MGTYADRRASAGASRPVTAESRDEWLERNCPALHDMMTSTVTSAGKRRETTTILIFCEQGLWKACVRDRHAGEVAFVAGDCLKTLLDHVEEGLAGDRLDWRPEKKWPQRGTGKSS